MEDNDFFRKQLGDIFFELGMALTDFAQVEFRMSVLFYVALGTNRYNESSNIFWSQHSCMAKCNMIGHALSRRIQAHPIEKGKWNEIKRAINSASKKRNKLAHGSAIIRNGSGYFAPYYWKRSNDADDLADFMFMQELPDPEEILNSEMIRRWSAEFRSLDWDIYELTQNLIEVFDTPRPIDT